MMLYFLMKETVSFSVPSNVLLTLLHSERPRLHTILVFLSAIGLRTWVLI